MSKGKVFLVGLGPGAAEQMSGRARQAIAESEVVIGYTKYLDLVQDLLDGKEVIRKAMTQEVDRCVAACEQARKGRTVSLVSSGDIGVYGMAGLTYEVLLRSGWTPEDEIGVEVVPGITALSACASLVGAPLSHDFCSISLSDLLTPWPVIARRLEAAAKGDFVVALYNPRSGRRRRQLLEARKILLRHRLPDTPVAIVDAAYRDGQATRLSTLGTMMDCEIGMLSTVLVGNSNTYRRADLMITPRGYSDKYDGLTGEVKTGERSGRSLSMGLEGWKACVRRYLRDSDVISLQDVARHFGAPLGEVLSAIAEAGPDDSAGRFTAVAVISGKETDLVGASRDWGHIRLTLENGMGAACELTVDAQDLGLQGDLVKVEHAHCRLEIDWRRVRHAWFVSEAGRLLGVQFVDAAGDAQLAMFLAQEGGEFAADAVERYERAWIQMAVAKHEP